MATIFEDDFNSYEDGNLVGQGGWIDIKDGVAYQVQGTIVKEGAKAVYKPSYGADHPRIYKTGTPTSEGRITFYVRKPATNDRFFLIVEKTLDSNSVGVWFSDDGNIKYYNGVEWVTIQSYNADQWYCVEAEWWDDAGTKKAHVRIDGGDWAATYNVPGNPDTLDLVRFYTDATDVAYIDYIAEYPYVPVETYKIEKSLKYCIVKTPSAKTKSLKYTCYEVIAIDKSLKYCVIVTPTKKTKSLKYSVSTSTKIEKSLRYDIPPVFDKRGFVYGTSSQSDPGNVAPGSSGYDTYVEDTGNFVAGAFEKTLINLVKGQTYYVRAYAHNDAGYGYGNEVSFTAKTDVKLTKSLKYCVIATTKIEKGLIYKALLAIAIQKALKYTVITTPTKKTKSLQYNIFLGSTKVEKGLIYRVRTDTKTQKGLIYKALLAIVVQKTLKYCVLTTPSAKTKSLKYDIFLGSTKIEKSLKYCVLTDTKIEKSLQYSALPSIAIQKALKYATITTPSALTKSLKYVVNPPPPQEISSGKVVVASDSTVATTPEDINGLSFDITLKNEGYIMAFMSLTSNIGLSDKKKGYFLININGVDSPVIIRYHFKEKDGNVEVIFRSGLLEAGQYTVKGRHYTEVGVTLTSKNITLVAFPTEDEGGNRIKSAYDAVASDSVTGVEIEDIDGLTQDITTDFLSFIFAMIVGSVFTSIKDKLYRLILSINGKEMEVDRFLDSVDDVAAIGLACRTQLPETAGAVNIKGRHASEAGVTGTIAPAILVGLDLATKSGEAGYVVPSGQICVEGAELSTISTVLEDMPTVVTQVTLTQEAHIFAVLTFEMESEKGDMDNHFAISINGVDFEEHGRTSNVKLDRAVITIVARTTTKLEAGTYTIKGRWRTTAGNTLRAINDLSLVAIGLETTTQDLPTHLLRSLDYKVRDSKSVTKGLEYAVVSEAEAIKIEKSLSYNIFLEKITIQKGLIYKIAVEYYIPLSLKYVVETTPIAITKALGYNIYLGATQIPKSLQYAVRKAVGITKGLVYKVLPSIAITKTLKYCVLSTPAAKQKELWYAIITAPTALTKGLEYRVLTIPSAITKSLAYEVLTETKIEKSLHYEIFSEQAITKSLKYTIVSVPTAIQKTLEYQVLTIPAAITKSLHYEVKKYPYEPFDPYEPDSSPYEPKIPPPYIPLPK